ncbi:hypothetical protein B0T19DRAFT_452218 [Cercophora scortea]|uniref:Uncharacterized protein n=1 Tax=Cercophora scortea TaxID=314031 RepID=A0AAE0J2F5_9PEZI|nr:hypothetical protein B0T19DRAFT_452218 [Cercophora scortea]
MSSDSDHLVDALLAQLSEDLTPKDPVHPPDQELPKLPTPRLEALERPPDDEMEPGQIRSSTGTPVPPGLGLTLSGPPPNMSVKMENPAPFATGYVQRRNSGSVHRSLLQGPVPVFGSPQDRFRRAVLYASPNGHMLPALPAPSSLPVAGGDNRSGAFSGPALASNPEALNPASTHRQPLPVGNGDQQKPVPTPQPTGNVANFKEYMAVAKRNPQPPPPKAPSSHQGNTTLQHQAPATPMQLLSLACQKRKFNPEWIEKAVGDKFTCAVRLRDQLVNSTRAYATPYVAKLVAAQKALKIVSSWGLPTGAEMDSTQSRATNNPKHGVTIKQEKGDSPRKVSAGGRSNGQASIKKERGAHGPNSQAGGTNGNNTAQSKPSGSEGNRDRRGTGHSTADLRKQQVLIEDIQKIMGIEVPDRSKDDPEVAKAFLEGLALGSRLAGSLSLQTSRGRSSRSRSPSLRNPDGNRFRTRSPVRPRIRTTPPPHYENFPGRPNSDHYRPEDSSGRDRPRGSSAEKWAPDGHSEPFVFSHHYY